MGGRSSSPSVVEDEDTTTNKQDELITKNELDELMSKEFIMAILANEIEEFKKLSNNSHSLNQPKDLLETLKNKHEYHEQSRPTEKLEQVEECIEKAQNAFNEGNCKKALRLLTKSERIYPTTRAKNLMQQVKNEILENGEDPDEVLQEGRKATERKDTDVPPPELKQREVTSEQIREIKRVLDAFDDYEILGISKGSSWVQVRKAYCRLTKILHPDMNTAEGAKRAFMAVKEATDRFKLRLRN